MAIPKSKVKNFVVGAAIASLLATVPVIAQDSTNTARASTKNFEKVKPSNGSLLAENKADVETVDRRMTAIFFEDMGKGEQKKACYLFKEVDKTFALFTREDGKIVAGFYKKNKDGKVSAVEPVDIFRAFEGSGYSNGEIGVHTLSEGSKYVLFPEGANRIIVVYEKPDLHSGGQTYENSNSFAWAPSDAERGFVVNTDPKIIEVTCGKSSSEKAIMVIDHKMLFVISEESFDFFVADIGKILKWEKKLDPRIEKIEELEIKPIGRIDGRDCETPDVKNVYIIEVGTKGDEKAVKRHYGIHFESKNDDQNKATLMELIFN